MMYAATMTPCNRDIRTVSIGAFRSSHKGEILLVYLNDGETDSAILRFDQLSGKDRHLVRANAVDPLRLLKRAKRVRKDSRRAA